MDYLDIKCGNCGSEFKIKYDLNTMDRETIACMACASLIDISAQVEALLSLRESEGKQDMSQETARLKELYESGGDGTEGLADSILENDKGNYLANFVKALALAGDKIFLLEGIQSSLSKTNYPDAFSIYYARLMPLLNHLNEAYQHYLGNKDALVLDFADKMDFAILSIFNFGGYDPTKSGP